MTTSDVKRLLWIYCPGHAGAKGNGRTHTTVCKATTRSCLHLRFEVLRFRHSLMAKCQEQGTKVFRGETGSANQISTCTAPKAAMESSESWSKICTKQNQQQRSWSTANVSWAFIIYTPAFPIFPCSCSSLCTYVNYFEELPAEEHCEV